MTESTTASRLPDGADPASMLKLKRLDAAVAVIDALRARIAALEARLPARVR